MMKTMIKQQTKDIQLCWIVEYVAVDPTKRAHSLHFQLVFKKLDSFMENFCLNTRMLFPVSAQGVRY